MPGFKGFGRHSQGPDKDAPLGGANPLFGYGGVNTLENGGSQLDLGVGVLNSEHMKLVQANAQAGRLDTENKNGRQYGAKAEASVFEMGGSLGDIAALFGADVDTSEKQGGWQNFFSGEVHGPKANAECTVGTEGLTAGAGAEILGGSAKIGGAEYDWLGGTEFTVGGGFGGVGASGGLHWSDDDGDGLREYGFSLGGDLGIGVDLGFKTELPGHIYNGVAAAGDWIADGWSSLWD